MATGLDRPIYVTHAPNDPERLFVVERGGDIKILNLDDHSINTTEFATVTGINGSGEGGLLGMAFHPDYDSNGKFYVYLTGSSSNSGTNFNSLVREYTVSSENPDVASTDYTTVIEWQQPATNHNGGWIGFSPEDGYLYVMSGDGGGSNDTGSGHTSGTGNAQDITDNLLGKVLRIDVDGTNAGNYGIPDDNPFVDITGDDEIWAYGVRNPWRSSFDRQTGDLWIGDVGQSFREEVDFQSADSTGGENYGWRLREGTSATPSGGVGGNRPPGNVDPVYEYAHGSGEFEGNSLVGGYVYRGADTSVQGKYLFGDSVSDNVWMFDPSDPTGTVENILDQLTPDVGSVNGLVSFGEDAMGNLYLVDIASSLFNQTLGTGEIFRVVTDTPLPGDYNHDGTVNLADYTVWRDNLGASGLAPFVPGDGNGDGQVSSADYELWKQQFGAVQPADSPVAVPEPVAAKVAIFSLFAVGWLVVSSAPRRRLQPDRA
ncbi:PQQ-dependent sugar dehydrogenase [Aeoliella mucimassa]|nr:PQQ-dependent sugar dehydrogenase [Aeoliella mucimassa]